MRIYIDPTSCCSDSITQSYTLNIYGAFPLRFNAVTSTIDDIGSYYLQRGAVAFILPAVCIAATRTWEESYSVVAAKVVSIS